MAEENSRQSYIMLISSMIIVGTVGVLRRYIPMSSGLIAFFRGAIGAVSLFLFCRISGKQVLARLPGKTLALLFLNGAFIGINWILLFEAFNYTSISKATLCYYMQPCIVLLLSPLVLREHLTAKKRICALTAFAGMILVSGVAGSGSVSRGELKGIVFGLGAAFFYAMVILINKKTYGVDPFQKTIIQLFSSAVVLIPYLLLTKADHDVTWNAVLILQLAVIGIVYTGLAYALYFGSMDGLKAQTIAVLSYIDPVVAMIVSAIVLKENMTAAGIFGAVLIIGSAVISEWEPNRQKVS